MYLRLEPWSVEAGIQAKFPASQLTMVRGSIFSKNSEMESVLTVKGLMGKSHFKALGN